MGGVSGWHLRRSGESELFTRSLRIGLIPVIVAILPSVAFGVPPFSYRNKSGSDSVLSLVSGDMMMVAGW